MQPSSAAPGICQLSYDQVTVLRLPKPLFLLPLCAFSARHPEAKPPFLFSTLQPLASIIRAIKCISYFMVLMNSDNTNGMSAFSAHKGVHIYILCVLLQVEDEWDAEL